MSKEYKTKDLGEAAALLTKGLRLLRLEREFDFYWFVFDGQHSQAVSDAYWSGELMVCAKDYFDKTRSLKDRLFSRR